MIVGISAAAIVVVVLVATVSYSLGSAAGKKKAPTVVKEEPLSPSEPATKVSVEQTSGAISQDISSLNDDLDFPADQLADKPLGL